MIKSS